MLLKHNVINSPFGYICKKSGGLRKHKNTKENDLYSTLTLPGCVMIKTRIADPSDYTLLAELGRQAFYEAFGSYQDPADMQAYLDLAFHHDTIRNSLNDTACTFIIASYDDQPVGYAKLKRGDPPKELKATRCIQLERIYSLQAFVGKKVGKALMKVCIQIAKNEQFSIIWLGVWQQNGQAISFYKKWGFEVIGTKQFIIGRATSDDYVMALEIPQNNKL
jgi:GNAT superfamily N-acetyltransferase